MSAYIVDDMTINRIVAYLRHTPHIHYLHHHLEVLGYRLHDPVEWDRLGRDLFALNVASVNARYGDGKAQDFRNLDYKYSDHILPPDSYQALASLRCWAYQSCEGDCDEEPIYQAMSHIAGSIAIAIVSNLPQYRAADWG